ncbi:hypothetical protein [Methanogenium cariaci]|jgi:hypothetical protein
MVIKSSAISDVLASAPGLSRGPDDIGTPFFGDTDVPDTEELRRGHTQAIL